LTWEKKSTGSFAGIDSRDDVVTVVLFPDDSKNHPFCYLSAKTKKKNIFLPIYLENWNKYITFAA
jgi:hypothetical protein